MKTIHGRNPQNCSILVLILFFPMIVFCQQKITIKDQDGMAMGHFVVETFLLDNSKEIALNGNIPTADSESETNQFRIKIGNLVWFNPATSDALSIDSKSINVNNIDDVRIELSDDLLTLNADGSKPIILNVTTQNYGDFKLDIPFKTPVHKGRFLLPLSVHNSLGIKSKDVRLVWKSVDDTNIDEIEDFIEEYENVSVAKKYIKSANRKLTKLKEKQKQAELQAALESEVQGEKDDAGLRNIENLESDVRDVAKSSIDKGENSSLPKEHSIVIEYENEIKAIKVTENDLPLRLQFLNEGEGIDDLDNMIAGIDFEEKEDATFIIDKNLLKEHDLTGDFVNLMVVNSHDKVLFEQPLNDLKTESKSYNNLIILGLLGLLSGIGFLVYRKRKQEKAQQSQNKKNLANKIKQHQATVENEQLVDQSKSNMTNVKKPTKIVIGNKGTQSKLKESGMKEGLKSKESSSKIKIVSHKIQSNSMTESEFKDLVTASEFTKVILTDIWQDSAISNVYIKKIFAQELQAFLAESSTSGIMNELQGAIPEVGGFLMGRYFENSDDIKLFVEKFVPFVPEYNDVFKIEIGTKTIVDELGDAQDKNPKLDVIGWFHTHPGHGLFLSVSDLSVQRHFPKQFQVAMEIDSLTTGLDMSMFSRKKNGQINNTQGRKEGAEWFSWVEIEKELEL